MRPRPGRRSVTPLRSDHSKGGLSESSCDRTLVAMTLIRTPFGFRSTAAEVAAGIDLTGKRAIVTGASSGIGVETARTLAGAGAQVTLAVRNTQAGSTAAGEIAAATRPGDPARAAPAGARTGTPAPVA